MDGIYTDILDVFYGGMGDDVRIQRSELSSHSSHFDLWTHPKRLVPYRNMEEDQNTAYEIANFLYTNSMLYGLGIVAASAKAKIYQRATDVITGTWTASTNGEDSAGSRSQAFFKDFHNYIYGSAAGTRLWAWGDLTGAPTFTATAYNGAGGAICQGIVTTDDLLIVPCTSGIAKKNGAGSGPTDTWSVFNLIPSAWTVTDLCEYGDFVIFAGKPTSGVGNSKAFIWDKVSLDLVDIIDFGDGDLVFLDEIEGELVGISNVGGLSAFGIKPKLVVRTWQGGNKAQVAFELPASGTGSLSINTYGNHCKFKDGNRLTFGLKIIIDSTTYLQLFSIGRKSKGYPLAFSFDRLIDNDTAITSLWGIYKLGSYVWAAHNADGSVNRTNDQAEYTNVTPKYETQKLNGSRQDPKLIPKTKQLVMAGLMHTPLTSGQSVSLYYRVNEETSWTLIRTNSTVSSIGFEAGIINAGTDFNSWKELQFKATSAGGAEITGIPYAFKDAGAEVISP